MINISKEPNGMSSDVLFCPIKSPNPKDTQSAVIYDERKQQTLTFKELESLKGWQINYLWIDRSIIRLIASAGVMFTDVSRCCNINWKRATV